MQGLRTHRAPLSLAVAALFFAKVFIAAALSAAPVAFASTSAASSSQSATQSSNDSAAGMSLRLPRTVVLCTPFGLRLLAMGDSDRPTPTTGDLNCPLCAVAYAYALTADLTLLDLKVAEGHRIDQPERSIDHSHGRSVSPFRSRAPPLLWA